MALLSLDQFKPIAASLKGRQVGFLPLPGDIGDRLTELGATRLFDHFDIDYITIDMDRLRWGVFDRVLDTIAISAGSRNGQHCADQLAALEAAHSHDLSVVLLPRTFAEPHESLDSNLAVFAPERTTLALDTRYQLAPDPALAVEVAYEFSEPIAPLGVFLNADEEALFATDNRSIADPDKVCDTVFDYLNLASRFEHVVTDRLQFAIAAMLAGRQATLLPDSSPGNRGVFEAWLEDIGCTWQENLSAVVFDREPVAAQLGELVGQSRSGKIAQSCRLRVAQGITSAQVDRQKTILDPDQNRIADLDKAGMALWQHARDHASFEEIVATGSGSDQALSEGELAGTARYLLDRGAVEIEDGRCQRHPVIGRRTNWLTLNPVVYNGSTVRFSAMFYEPTSKRLRELWFDTDRENEEFLIGDADPFVLGVLHRCMVEGQSLWVRGGSVSTGLLENLDEYQAAWHCWHPELQIVRIHAEEAPRSSADRRAKTGSRKAISCFSGGLDSTHTVFRESSLRETPRSFELGAALMVHGFDIFHEDRRTWETALGRASGIMDQTAIPLLTLKTNVRAFNTDWPVAHGLAAASCLTLFSRKFELGLIPGTFPYNMIAPWGTNPITDRLMGSDAFVIENNSADRNRFEKLSELADYPEVVDLLRICWQDRSRDTNCGRCIKCVMTGLMALTAGLTADFLGDGFSEEVACEALDIDAIARADWFDAQQLFREASKRGITAPWVASLAKLRPM